MNWACPEPSRAADIIDGRRARHQAGAGSARGCRLDRYVRINYTSAVRAGHRHEQIIFEAG